MWHNLCKIMLIRDYVILHASKGETDFEKNISRFLPGFNFFRQRIPSWLQWNENDNNEMKMITITEVNK